MCKKALTGMMHTLLRLYLLRSLFFPAGMIICLLAGCLSYLPAVSAGVEATIADASTKTKSASERSSTEIASAFQQLLAPVKTLQAEFVQVTTDAGGRNIETTRGRMQLKRPQLFRWEVKDPFPQYFISNGRKIWINDIALKQVTVRRADQQASAMPAMILSGDTDKLVKNYQFKLSASTEKQVFTLIPLQKDSLFESLQLIFIDRKLQKMLLSDSLGASTKISFSDIRVNLPIAEKQFVFVPPKGANILDELQD